MVKLCDGKYIMDIRMEVYEDNQLKEDYASDFFQVGKLPYMMIDGEKVYDVLDVFYCKEQAKDWEIYEGDFDDEVEKDWDIANGVSRFVETFLQLL